MEANLGWFMFLFLFFPPFSRLMPVDYLALDGGSGIEGG